MAPRPDPNDPRPDPHVLHAIAGWRRDIIGPGFMWASMYEALECRGGFAAAMDACEPATQALVLEAFREMPWTSVWTDRQPDEPPHRKVIREWCEARL